MSSEQIAEVQVLELPGLNTFDSVSSLVIVGAHYQDGAIVRSQRINVHDIPKHNL